MSGEVFKGSIGTYVRQALSSVMSGQVQSAPTKGKPADFDNTIFTCGPRPLPWSDDLVNVPHPSAHPPGCDESAIGAVYWKNPAAPEVGARAKCTSGQRIRSAASTAVSPPDTFVSVRRSLAGPHNSRSVLALQF